MQKITQRFILSFIAMILIHYINPLPIYASSAYDNAIAPKKNPIHIKVKSKLITVPAVESTNSSIEYLGTLKLSSKFTGFGGLSDLIVSNDRKTILAISDKGLWFRGKINYSTNEQLKSLSPDMVAGQLLNVNGNIDNSKKLTDAEALTGNLEQGFYIGYERKIRINHVASNSYNLSLKPLPTPIARNLKDLPRNGALETLVLLKNDTLIAISEGDDTNSPSKAAFRKNGVWSEFYYQRDEDYRPTSAATYPDNKIVVLERKYKGPGTLGMRLRTFSLNNLNKGKVIEPKLLATINKPVPLDNYEGIHTVVTKNNTAFIYIISDNNFNLFQNTYLSLFKIKF